MDGWGVNPQKAGNATAIAATPNLTRLFSEYPSTELYTSGLSVGLPDGQMGNSEVGHLTLGAGRVVFQEFKRISDALKAGELKQSPVLSALFDKLKDSGSTLHVMGLLSDGGVHSHIDHLYAVLEAAKARGLENVCIHAFMDGRDTPPESGRSYMEALLSRLEGGLPGRVATVSGRYYAMDRDNRWERVSRVYEAMVEGRGAVAKDPVAAINASYEKGESDEFIKPAVITGPEGAPSCVVADNDAIVFFNFRSDRAREIAAAFASKDFDGFERSVLPVLAGFVGMAEYDPKLNLPALFKPASLNNLLGEVLSRKGLRQFRVSETEKYAHVTFFFNGGREEPFPGEERLLIPSVRDVPTYDLAPEMRAIEIAEAAVERIESGDFSFMLMNFANGDMVGHTGVLEAAVKACETVDRAVGMVADAALKRGWAVLVTADHGNAEKMVDESTNSPFTAHTTNPVPFILVDSERKGVHLMGGCGLASVAPTVLKIMGIEKPADMTGEPLF
ncbi:MAG: phosphoglycerate mutase (2,3-diphosphoglycerate-independent) [Deltaproteobacteria bacterium GWA2_55_10]|nr:MAG: phosphoglycerate mutase (2,3-diphosphoglycerate-independent) [Deltaproteobacteria bacterium GWA2_55_10]